MTPAHSIIAIPRIGSPQQARMFKLAEAEELLPLVRKITATAVDGLAPWQRCLSLYPAGSEHSRWAQQQYAGLVKAWMGKMCRLGLSAPGLWQVGFDTGDGYICWQYPETRLIFFRNYADRFQQRKALKAIIQERLPDWA